MYLIIYYKTTKEDENFSLSSIENKTPEIIEFDIDIESTQSSTDNGTLSNEFPSSLLDESKTFYMVLEKKILQI